jgi:16S rRNA (guanine966-N2)-methyltransferase
MRIVAGVARGRRLEVPRGGTVRPTADRVREALFSSLQPRLAGAHVLDLFAGAGGLGLEAASRGAARVVLVERDPRVLEVLRRNVATVGVEGVEVHAGEVRRLLRAGALAGPFDLVLVDPPYDLPDEALEAVLDALVGHLATDAVVVVERAARSGAVGWPEPLRPEPVRRYGDTALHRAVLPAEEDST